MGKPMKNNSLNKVSNSEAKTSVVTKKHTMGMSTNGKLLEIKCYECNRYRTYGRNYLVKVLEGIKE
jgi:hypothetical protein